MSEQTIVIGRCHRCRRDTVQKVCAARGGRYCRCYCCGKRVSPFVARRRREKKASVR